MTPLGPVLPLGTKRCHPGAVQSVTSGISRRMFHSPIPLDDDMDGREIGVVISDAGTRLFIKDGLSDEDDPLSVRTPVLDLERVIHRLKDWISTGGVMRTKRSTKHVIVEMRLDPFDGPGRPRRSQNDNALSFWREPNGNFGFSIQGDAVPTGSEHAENGVYRDHYYVALELPGDALPLFVDWLDRARD